MLKLIIGRVKSRLTISKKMSFGTVSSHHNSLPTVKLAADGQMNLVCGWF